MGALLFVAGIGVLTHFEGGSVGRIERVSATHLRCAVAGQADRDHRNRQADWYYFQLVNLPKQELTVDLVDLAGEYNYQSPAYSVTQGTRPVYSYDGVTWTHFRDEQVSWDAKEPHLSLRFTPEHDRMWIAHVPPYTNRDLARLLDSFRASPYLQRTDVGQTVEGRPMPLLTFTNAKIEDSRKKVVWLMFRQHAWETGSSWVCEGALKFLLSSDGRAARIRDHAIFKIFPMADPDGVAAGRVRFNGNGYDLNRNWDTIDPATMPEIAAQHRAVLDWVDSGHRVDLFLSLHNTEHSEYLEAPVAFQELGGRLWRKLSDTSTFNPTEPVRNAGATTTPGKAGRMNVGQGLFHDRHLPAMIMEQMIEYNSKLGQCPAVKDRIEFGAALVRALLEVL